MDLNDTPELAEYRAKVRSWLDDHKAAAPDNSGGQQAETPEYIAERRAWQAELTKGGLNGITWPAEYGGQGLGPLHQVVANQEIGRAGVPGILDIIGVGMLGPTIMAHGSEEQKHRHLGPMLTGDEVWCQLFSEPPRARTSPACRPAPASSPTGRGGSAARRCGRPTPSSPPTASSSRGRTPTSRSTRG
jgi:alkylation response protein AidB-like acyl-CoA dehydrogenase